VSQSEAKAAEFLSNHEVKMIYRSMDCEEISPKLSLLWNGESKEESVMRTLVQNRRKEYFNIGSNVADSMEL
jgi:hypothetical protein